MKRSKPKLGFRNKTVTQKMSICGNFIRGAAKLPEEQRIAVRANALAGELADTDAAVNRVESLRSELRAAVAARNAKLDRLCLSVTGGMGAYSAIAQKDSDLLAVGLRLEKARLPVGVPGIPTALRGTAGAHTGTVQLHFKRPVRRCAFVIQCSTDVSDPTKWKLTDSACSTHPVITDLRSGELYWFRVAAFNNHGQGSWTQPIRVRAA